MQLTYRGIPYELNAVTTETIKHETTGKYRGVTHKIRPIVRVKTKPVFELKYFQYRGVAYMKIFGKGYETEGQDSVGYRTDCSWG